uniref:Global nitrogen transcriptional regulator n=1 Tax=Spyridia filamentosa TaxID=196632 RepID=A0A1Z1MKA1_SPYFI|nr:global nitrogen transcriptional regulator [Spyridia filamentosa]ARW66299.1 global nitrogen transcriptional regulator [Spyridia filamentosa]
MQWINNFFDNKIPFYIYQLNQGDAIIYTSKNSNKIIILSGVIYIMQIFTNQEKLPLAILSNNHIIHLDHKMPKNKYYYEITAIKRTYLISFKSEYKYGHKKLLNSLMQPLVESYKMTLNAHIKMQQILIHKYIQYRFLQLIIFLCKEFGYINKEEVIIPFKINQQELGFIIGSNKKNINQIISKFKRYGLIKYSSKKIICISNIFSFTSFTLY